MQVPASDTAGSRRLATELAALVTYIHRRCAADMLEIVGSLELSISQVKALHLLDLVGPRTLGELAGQIHLSPAATGRAVDDMHHMALVERFEDAADRRVRRVRITTGGAELLARIADSRKAVLEELVGTLDDVDQAALSAALAPLLAHAEIPEEVPA
jgi:DNA-binding MarR family transcriptional regulator